MLKSYYICIFNISDPSVKSFEFESFLINKLSFQSLQHSLHQQNPHLLQKLDAHRIKPITSVAQIVVIDAAILIKTRFVIISVKRAVSAKRISFATTQLAIVFLRTNAELTKQKFWKQQLMQKMMKT